MRFDAIRAGAEEIIDKGRETTMKNFEERRECKRYRSRDDQAAYVAVRPTFKRIGTVKDVSVGGLGIIYSLMEDQIPLSEEGTVSLDLFVSNNAFYLPMLKCRLAYDKHEKNQSWAFSSGMQFRQCGLEFDTEALTSDQKKKLQLFLENYTAGEA